MRKAPTTRMAAIKWQRLILGSLLVLNGSLYGQPPIPKFQSFQPINLTSSAHPVQVQLLSGRNPMLPNDPYAEQNRKILERAGMAPGPVMPQQQIPSEVHQDLQEQRRMVSDNRTVGLLSFQNNLAQFLLLNPDSFSITKAVYLSESAYYGSPPPYGKFESSIKQGAELVKQILKKEGLSEKDNLAINYAIQKLYSQENEFYDSSTGRKYLAKKLQYDFDDFLGEKDWTKMFVTKLLQTGAGQCHSLPLFYLCIAEQLHAKAYLSLSPNHSFIQYLDNRGNRYNFETTNGNLVSQTWLVGSNFVTSEALKNKTYLDTLSHRKLYAQCLGDFLLSYLMKAGHYDGFSNGIMKKILSIDSTNITALMERANFCYLVYQKELNAAGSPPNSEYARYPNLYSAYYQYVASQQKVDQTGFQSMPKEAYQAWLKSLDDQKQLQQNQAEQQRMEREIKRLKSRPSKLINNLRG
jgi:hypothetical protein